MRDKFREKLKAFSLPGRNAYGKVPAHLHEGICAYIVDGITPGGFFTAVICNDLRGAFNRADRVCNDLRGAFNRADRENQASLCAIVQWMHQYAPSECWGSVERMVSWQVARTNNPLKEADWLIL